MIVEIGLQYPESMAQPGLSSTGTYVHAHVHTYIHTDAQTCRRIYLHWLIVCNWWKIEVQEFCVIFDILSMISYFLFLLNITHNNFKLLLFSFSLYLTFYYYTVSDILTVEMAPYDIVPYSVFNFLEITRKFRVRYTVILKYYFLFFVAYIMVMWYFCGHN